MKKLMFLFAAAAFAGAVQADCTWSWWLGDNHSASDVNGCALGLGIERRAVKGAELAICCGKAEKVASGVLGAIGYSETKTLANGAQFAFVNMADSAALQFGLLCFNKTGFLPFFVFFNFDSRQFGSKASK